MSWSAQINVKILKDGVPVFWTLDFPLADRPESDSYQKLPPVTLADLISIRDAVKGTPLLEHNAKITVRFSYSGMSLDTPLGHLRDVRYSRANDLVFNPLTSDESLKTMLLNLGKTSFKGPKGLRVQDEQY